MCLGQVEHFNCVPMMSGIFRNDDNSFNLLQVGEALLKVQMSGSGAQATTEPAHWTPEGMRLQTKHLQLPQSKLQGKVGVVTQFQGMTHLQLCN